MFGIIVGTVIIMILPGLIMISGDFGLSEVRRGKEKKMDQDEAPGSVLFMAPEVGNT